MAKRVVTDAEIGARLREKRRAAEVSQPDLGAAIGVSEQMVQKYEIGGSPLTVVRLYAIARKLRCAVTDLLP
jgi:transcriptional regulator with XRE-family HTH domain